MRPSKRKRVNDAIHTVNVSRMLSLATIKDESNVFATVPVVALLTSSKIHLDLSNVWNDYKVEKIALTATPLSIDDLLVEEGGVISGPREYFKLFCAWDNNDVSHQLRYSDIKTYESYKDITYSITANNETPILRFSTDPKLKKMDTKKTPNYGTLIIGINSPVIFGESIDINITVNFTFTVCYSCPRFDTSWVSTLIAPEFQQLPDARTQQTIEVPVPVEVRIPPRITKLVYIDVDMHPVYTLNINDVEFTYTPNEKSVHTPKDHAFMTIHINKFTGAFEDFSFYEIGISGDDNYEHDGFDTIIYPNSYYKVFPKPPNWNWSTLQDKSGKIWVDAKIVGRPDIDLFHFPDLSVFVSQY